MRMLYSVSDFITLELFDRYGRLFLRLGVPVACAVSRIPSQLAFTCHDQLPRPSHAMLYSLLNFIPLDLFHRYGRLILRLAELVAYDVSSIPSQLDFTCQLPRSYLDSRM